LKNSRYEVLANLKAQNLHLLQISSRFKPLFHI
jgi:hypothetical protein